MVLSPRIDAADLLRGEVPHDAVCAIVEGQGAVGQVLPEALPPIPVIAVGSAGADWVDVLVPDAQTAEKLARRVERWPQAAGVLVQVLRLLPTLPVQQGLVAESLAYGLLQGGAEHGRWLAARPPARVLADTRALRAERAGGVLRLTLDHPASGNAIDRSLRDALFEMASLAALDDTITRVVLRAEGRAFSLGAELAEFGTTRDPAQAHAIRMRSLPALPLAQVAERLEVHVQGACVGAGLEMAAWARRLTASPRAWFQLPELAMGLIPGAGGCVSLTRRIGRQRTAELVLSGRRLSARQALAIGLIDAIVDQPPGGPGGHGADRA